MDKIKLYLINGALGVGKTKLVDWSLSQENFVGSRANENDFNSTSVDVAIVDKRAPMKYLQLLASVSAVAMVMS